MRNICHVDHFGVTFEYDGMFGIECLKTFHGIQQGPNSKRREKEWKM